MSRKASDNVEYTLRSLSSLMGERRRKQPEPDAASGAGERSLLAAESTASLQSAGGGSGGAGGSGGIGGSGGDLERAARRQFQQDETPAFVYVAAAFSALGGFLFGYDTGVVSGAMLLLKRQLSLDALWQELLVSSTVGAAAVAALAGGALNGVFGRRAAILLASALFTAGSAVLAAAANKETLLAGRLVVGFGIGIASMTVPVYIAEVSPPNLRGQLVTINTLFITGGQFFASVVDGAFSYLQKDGWRYMLGLAAIPAVIQFFGFLFLPESPRWLIQKGQTQKARRILSQMRGNQTIDEEYDSIKNNIEEEEKEVGSAGPVICRMLSYPPTRRALIVGCGLQMFQQLSGINTIIYCNECMLDPDCGFCYKMNKSAVIDSSCIPVNKASTNQAAWGRCENETRFKTEEVFWAYNFCPTPYSWTALVGLILYLVFFAPGMGPMPWTVNSEIYPLWARSTGNACSSGINWICNVVVSLTFLHTAEYLTYYGAFFLYAGFAAVGLVFVYGCLPETKGKKLEEIESLFDNRLCTCGASDSDEGRYIEYIRVKGSNYHLSDNDASDVE
ncbi:proton myo-inositol cotransporter isoform X2 [Perognathus longimembris pacificus]|uniref:proton myo-inositol cotransporter isoform X2 n=1 Tax=Perognathus longimembris pacificus TaxID=214514 RepID=UPI002019BCF0|nr:proton myo-inositol cotransporter isoform X2 [Perognathus longimembris pacificus]